MKKKVLLLFLMMSISASASYMYTDDTPDPLPLSINPGSGDGSIGGNAHPKSPVQIPVVYLDGHTISFGTPLDGCEVRLLDEEEIAPKGLP